jgi:hypothetical protein
MKPHHSFVYALYFKKKLKQVESLPTYLFNHGEFATTLELIGIEYMRACLPVRLGVETRMLKIHKRIILRVVLCGLRN